MSDMETESTGEPPTLHSGNTIHASTGASSTASSVIYQSSGYAGTSPNTQTTGPVVIQEMDSGYEASPSSTAENSSFNFDQGHTGTEDSAMPFEMDDVLSHPSIEGERDNSLEVAPVNNCQRCGSVCLCYYRVDSVSSNNLRRLSEDVQSSRGSELSGGRPSSLPVSIPLRSGFAGYLPICSPMLHSNPVAICRQTSSEQRPYSLPLSWPSVAVLGDIRGRWYITRPSWDDMDSGASFRGIRAAPTRNRRRLIDSDASSLSSSEDDGPEDVFDAEDDSLPNLSANAFGLPSSVVPRRELLPDLIPMHSTRRIRSVSVNLPLGRVSSENSQMIVGIGRLLRRLSDEFAREREASSRNVNNRRFTIGDFMDYEQWQRNQRNNNDDGSEGGGGGGGSSFSAIVLNQPRLS